MGMIISDLRFTAAEDETTSHNHLLKLGLPGRTPDFNNIGPLGLLKLLNYVFKRTFDNLMHAVIAPHGAVIKRIRKKFFNISHSLKHLVSQIPTDPVHYVKKKTRILGVSIRLVL
jgi:hypothetical protein